MVPNGCNCFGSNIVRQVIQKVVKLENLVGAPVILFLLGNEVMEVVLVGMFMMDFTELRTN